jgi:hypothetical protein
MRSRFIWAFVFIWLYGTFSAPGFAEVVHTTNETDSATISSSQIDAFKAALGKNGFTVTEWTYGKVDVARLVCLGALETGYANNAGGNYLAITNNELGVAVASEFQLKPNDAVVIIGHTPPPVAYFSYRSYLFKRQYEGESDRRTLFASLGDTFNNLTIKSEGTANANPNPYNQNVFIVSTADRGVDTQVRSLAMGAGFSPDFMNTDVIPSSVVKLGIGRDFDSFVFLNRITLPAYGHVQEFNDYMQNPGMTVLYLSQPSTATPLDPYPTPILRVRGTGMTEADLMPSLGELRKAIIDKYPGYEPTEFITKIWLNEWLDGIQRKENILGEIRDTSYLRTTTDFMLADDPDEFLIIYGVNHQATGKATYSSFSVYQEDKDLGISAVNSPVFAGSAMDYIPNNDNAPYLYAWKAARNCGNDPQCLKIELPEYLQPCTAVDLNLPLFVGFRAYLEPATAVGPNPAELLYDQVIMLKKSSTINIQNAVKQRR